MKRQGLTRIVALVTLVSMLSSDFTAFAANDTTTTSTEVNTDTATTAAEDSTAQDGDTNKEASATSDTDYVNEMLEKNYTKVSAKYTYSEYTGKTLEFPVTDAYVAEKSKGTLTADNYDYKNEVVLLKVGEGATFKITAPKNGVYVLSYDYLASDEGSILVPETKLTLNGESPFYEANRLVYESLWKDAKEPAQDRFENQIVAVPNKLMEWQKKYILDAGYRYSTPLKLELKEGVNEITLDVTEGTLMIGNFYLEAETEIPSYKEGDKAEGDYFQTIQGELPYTRNDSSIRGACEYDVDLEPYSVSKRVLNIIDSVSYNDAGMKMTYEINAPKDGYYYVAFNYRQDKRIDMPVFMNILVDGKIPNTELQYHEFYYTKKFVNYTLTDSNDKKIAIYLEKGKHYITTAITNDNVRATLEVVDKVMNEVNDLSLEITKVAGTGQDKYRDIKIKEYIPDIEDRLANWTKLLETEYSRLKKYSQEETVGALSSLRLAITKLESLAEEPDEIPSRLKEVSTGSSSVSQYLANFITDISGNNISFDRIYVYQDGSEDQIPGKSNIFVKIWEAIKRFFTSFGEQAYSANNVEPTRLQVWINRPRQYLEIIQQMIDTYFTPETGIEVDLCIMPDAQKLILSNAAGSAPDVAQAVDYAQPFELAIRNALVDLTEFDDYKEVMSQFSPGLLVPSTIGDSIYSLPETFYFWVLFYRTDILDKLGLEAPDTLDDVKEMLPELKNRGLDFFYPTAGTTGTRTFSMTTPLFYQYGASLYGDDEKTTINSDAGVKAFTELTELFTIYDIEREVGNFYQHFRNGDIPIGVSDYFTYSMLINAAPEIENSWTIKLVPGVEDENGVVQRQTAGAAQSSVIMDNHNEEKIVLTNGSTMERKDAAWEYLKWWMSTETQVEFGTRLQTTYGEEYIWNSANTEAFSQLPWKSRDKQTILEQMNWITESPRIPGTYMLERELSNAYVAVVISGKQLRTSLDDAVKNIDRETKRKLQEFGYLNDEGKVIKDYKVPSVDTVKEILGKND